MKLSIIIVSYNTKSLLEKCLNSIYKTLSKSKSEYEIIIVDNASSDGSVEEVKRLQRAQSRRQKSKIKSINPNIELRIIENKQNLGFATANNKGIKASRGEYILLLNSDTQVRTRAIDNLLEVIGKDDKIGVVGPKLIYSDGTFQPSAGFFPHIFKIFLWMSFIDDILFIRKYAKPYHVEDRSYYTKEQKVDWISGACMLIRKEALELSGLFDEKIFMYGEEVDLCFRIKKHGLSVIYSPKSTVLHHKGASSKGHDAGILEEFKFLKYFYKKHKPLWQLYLLYLFLHFGALLRFVTFGIILKRKKRAQKYAEYFKMAG